MRACVLISCSLSMAFFFFDALQLCSYACAIRWHHVYCSAGLELTQFSAARAVLGTCSASPSRGAD